MPSPSGPASGSVTRPIRKKTTPKYRKGMMDTKTSRRSSLLRQAIVSPVRVIGSQRRRDDVRLPS